MAIIKCLSNKIDKDIRTVRSVKAGTVIITEAWVVMNYCIIYWPVAMVGV